MDFLVLARGAQYVGFGSSTFSFFLREYRMLQGLPRSSSVLVDASVIGTDALFQLLRPLSETCSCTIWGSIRGMRLVVGVQA